MIAQFPQTRETVADFLYMPSYFMSMMQFLKKNISLQIYKIV